MEKYIRFKIIELDTHQVLFMKDWDKDDDCEAVVVFFDYEGINVKQIMGFESESDRDAMFDKANNELAQLFIDNITNMTK